MADKKYLIFECAKIKEEVETCLNDLMPKSHELLLIQESNSPPDRIILLCRKTTKY